VSVPSVRAMSTPRTPVPGGEPVRYRIRIDGHLEQRWSEWFDEMSLSRETDGTTVLTGPVADQSALHGLLQMIRDLGLPLLSVTPDTSTRQER
jgi:hypothetical protein